MRLEEVFPIVDTLMAMKVTKDPAARSISQDEIEKKVDYILSSAKKKLVLNHDDFLNVKGAFIHRLGLIHLDDHTQLNRLRELLPPNRLTELLPPTGGRRTRYRRKSRRTRKYKK